MRKPTQGSKAAKARARRHTKGGGAKPVIRNEAMGIRQRKTGSTQVGFRLPDEAVDYYTAEAEASGRSKVDVLVDAIYLDRDLSRRLKPHRAKLEAAAKAMGLDLDLDFAEVLTKLIEAQIAHLQTDPPARSK